MVLGTTPPDEDLQTTLEGGLSLETTTEPLPKQKTYMTLPSSSYSSLMPYQAPQVKEVLKNCFQQPIHKIVDMTAHIGGDSILFAETFPEAKIVVIDNDQNAIRCLLYNINNFSDPLRFTVICGNSVEWIEKPQTFMLAEADFYYLDCPWGGPRYYQKKEVHLTLDGTPLAEVVNTIFSLGLTKKVLVKVPRNFAYPSFKEMIKGTCKLFYIKKPLKNGSIAYGLVLVTSEKV